MSQTSTSSTGIAFTDGRDLGAFIPSKLDDYGLDPYTFRVYCHIVRRAGGGDGCYSTQGNMADVCNMSRRKLIDCIAELVKIGLIVEDDEPVKGRRGVRRYRLAPVNDVHKSTAPVNEMHNTPARYAQVPVHNVHTEGTTSKGTPKKGKNSRHQKLFVALAEACGWDTSNLPDSAGGRLGKAAKELAAIDATPADVHAKAKAYRERWPDIDLTPQGLTGNWAQVEASTGYDPGPAIIV